MSRRGRSACALLLMLAAVVGSAGAQWQSQARAGAATRTQLRDADTDGGTPCQSIRVASACVEGPDATRRAGASGGNGAAPGGAERRRWAPVASLLLPGTGQALLGKDRFVAYLALEAWAVLEFTNERTEARRQQSRYRALARDIARAPFGPSLPVGPWSYYEVMEHYLESGVFDRIPGGDVDPELDADTYNGAMWLAARTTYWSDPNVPPATTTSAYRNAMNYYLDRAMRPQFRWSWRNAQLEQDLYVRTIRRYNFTASGARAALGAVLANHMLSAVDAFVTLRIEGLDGGSGPGFALRGTLRTP